MGGAGGSGIGKGLDRERLARLRTEAEAQAKDAAQAGEVNRYLRDTLAAIGQRDVGKVQDRLDEVERALGSDTEGMETTIFGGSVAKHTYVDGLSDIDSLVLLDAGSLEGKTPATLLEEFARSLRIRIPRAEVENIEAGTLAVTVKYRDGMEVQLLPAYRSGSRFSIADAAGSGWRVIDPSGFARRLTNANKRLAGMLVPTIKLAKSVIGLFPERRRISGYHVEALAEKAFKGYQGERTPQAMLKHFFGRAATLVRTPIVDQTGQSTRVDAELGTRNSLERRIVADSFARVARRMRSANSIEQWRDIIEGQS